MVDNWTKQMSTLHTLLRHHSTQPELSTAQEKKHSVLGVKDASYLSNFVGEHVKKQHQHYNTASNFSKSVDSTINQMETDITTLRCQLDTIHQSPPLSGRFNNLNLIKSSPKKQQAPFPTLNTTVEQEQQILPVINEEDVIVNIRQSVRDSIRRPKTKEVVNSSETTSIPQQVPNPTQYMMQTASLPSPVSPKENIKLSFLESASQNFLESPVHQ